MIKTDDELGRMFPQPKPRIGKMRPKRTYDVKITLNKSGPKKPNVIRFGFINNGASLLGQHQYIEASDIEYTKNRIYFRSHDEKLHRNIHVLSTNSENRQDSCYFTITPSPKAEKAYRMNWMGKTYPILYDTENNLYYIENLKEE